MLTIGLCLAVCALTTLIVFFVSRAAAQRRIVRFESRLTKLERTASREALDQLRTMRYRVGTVYLDGLVFTSDKAVARLFSAGLHDAARANWDRALNNWGGARKSADGSEAVALDFLCGCCHILRGRAEEARTIMVTALKAASKQGNRAGKASCLFALGSLEEGERQYRQARFHFAASSELWRILGEVHEQTNSLTRLAEVIEKLGDTHRALEIRRHTLRLMEKSGDKKGMAAQYGAIGDIFARQGDMDQARAAHEDGLHLARQSGDRLAEAERLAAIGDIHLSQDSLKRALDVFERALKIYREVHKPYGQARVLYKLAVVHRRLGDQGIALEYYEYSLKLARRIGDRVLQARNLEGVASGCVTQGAFERALPLLEEAIKLDRETESTTNLVNHLVAFGKVLLEQHEFLKAEQCLKEALTLARHIGTAHAGIPGIFELSRALRGQGKDTEVLELLEKHKSRIRGLNNPKLEAALHSAVGLSYLALNRHDLAVSELKTVIDLRRKLSSKTELGRDLVNLGVALEGQGKADGGRSSIENGLRELHSAGAKTDEAWALCALAEVHMHAGRFRSVRQNLVRALELSREADDAQKEGDCLLGLGRLCVAERESDQARLCFEQAERIYSRLSVEEKLKQVRDELGRIPHSETGVQFLDDLARN